ncbi:MAG: cysteine--tRNA ligase [Opitutales bacterium]|nr:cysteine--tRNA ligase [Opitutales bacterium]
MEPKLYNTLTRETESVYAADGKTLGIYCCGPTVYGPAHIGNFRSFTLQDLLRRVVEATGLRTKHVRNYTDVDDKTIRGAQAEGIALFDFTEKWRKLYEVDCERLNLLRPHVSPSAVGHMEEQIELISTLLEKGLAYQVDNGSVYFRISAFEDYGKLSKLKREGIVQNADQRLNDSDEYDKESWNDFALWKAWKEEDGPNRWSSPWGDGRPGWHTECSAMSTKYLGDSFDFHSGGVDLMFPHHENEIAQCEGATGKQFVRHWFHIAHLRVEGSKMSKSLGNLYTIDDIMAWGYHPMELRYVLISGHYRQPLNFTRDSLNAAQSAMKRLSKVAKGLGGLPKKFKQASWGRFEPVLGALCDDLNTSKALGSLHTALGELEDLLKENEPSEVLRLEAAALAKILDVLGLELVDYSEPMIEIPDAIRAIADERWDARSAKNWARSDELRDLLLEKGWRVKDGKEGYALEAVS